MITRYKALKELIKRLNDSDIAIFVGSRLCQEAYANDREGNFYIPDVESMTMSFTLGLSMATTKRVFLFTSDSMFLRGMSVAAQMAVSQCKNLIYVILSSGTYVEAGGHPNIFNSMSHPQGVLFRLGFTAFVFDNYYDNSLAMSELKSILDTLIGPVAILINVSTKKSTSKHLDKSVDFFLDRLHNFMNIEGTALFEPPPLERLDIFNLEEH